MRIRLSMLAILDEAGRKFNADKLDGISRRDNVKHHFFVRYRAFESWAHGTVHEVLVERLIREASALRLRPARRYDTVYWERLQVGCDAYVELRGSRYSVPSELAGQVVTVRRSLEGQIRIRTSATLPAPRSIGWRGSARHMEPTPLPSPV